MLIQAKLEIVQVCGTVRTEEFEALNKTMIVAWTGVRRDQLGNTVTEVRALIKEEVVLCLK